jgi:transglutaminase-like putative cysteine protease
MSAVSRAARRERQRGSWTVSLAVLVTIGVPLAGLAPFVRGADWWFAAMAMAAVCVAASWAARAVGLRPSLGVVAAFLAWVVASQTFFAPGTAILGIVPTPQTVDTLISGFADAGSQIQVQTIPADPVLSLVQLIAMASGLVAILADAAVITRFPAVIGVLALALFIVPSAVQARDVDVVRFVVTMASFLLLLWLCARVDSRNSGPRRGTTRAGRSPFTAIALGATAVVCALVIPAVTPGLTAEAFAESRSSARLPSIYGAGVDPVIQLGRDLRRTTPILSLSYVTTADEPLYLKMVDLDDFSTGTWQPEQNTGGTVESLAPPAGLVDSVERTTVSTDVSIEGLRSEWLPLPYPATGLTNAGRGWSAASDTGVVTLPSSRNDSRGDDYSVESLVVAPSADQLAAAGSTVPDALVPLLELPPNLPAIVSDTATEVTAGATNNYDRAVALQSYFTSGIFDYSVETPVEESFDGSNAEALAAFLEVKSGYCVHFAASMATMARVLGIPSRIAVGYFPSAAATRYVDDEPEYEVLTDQLHSWPELYFEGIGWLPFEPTPSLGISVPEYTLPAYAEQATDSQAVAPQATEVAPTARARDEVDPSAESATGATRSLAQLRGWLTALAIAAGVLLAGLVPAGVRRWRRRSSLASIDSSDRPATEAWRELQNFARDYGVEVSSGDTPAAFGGRLHGIRRVSHVDVDLLLRAVEREQYADSRKAPAGGLERAGVRTALLEVESSIAEEAESSVRRRARLLPKSLFVRSGLES